MVADVSRTAAKKTVDDDNSDKVRSKRTGLRAIGDRIDNLSAISVTMAKLIVTGRAFEMRMDVLCICCIIYTVIILYIIVYNTPFVRGE